MIIGKSSIDTKAKVLLLRQAIAALPAKMSELQGDVKEFNLYVQHKRDELLGRGQTVDELMAHIFQAYLRVSDDNFIRYIQSKKDQYEEEGTMTAEVLMELALGRYNLIKQQNAAVAEGEDRIIALQATSTPTTGIASEGERIVALEAQLQLMQDKFNNRNRKQSGSKPKYTIQPWKRMKPNENEKQTKVHNERTYHWCRFHEMWTAHHPKDCTLGKKGGGQQTTPPPPQGGNVQNALQALMYTDEYV